MGVGGRPYPYKYAPFHIFRFPQNWGAGASEKEHHTMKILIPGGSGQVGTLLARALHEQGHDVVVLSRNPTPAPWRTAHWDAETLGDWATELDGADAVVNLAGRSVNCRYNAANRKAITDSRVQSTRVVGEAIARASHPPPVWLQMSTATIYAHRLDAPNDEATGILGGSEPDLPDTWRFSLDVARAWERTLDEADTPQTRKVAMRSAMVMSADRGGIFDTLLGLTRHGLGRAGRERPSVRIVDSRGRFRPGHSVADRTWGRCPGR